MVIGYISDKRDSRAQLVILIMSFLSFLYFFTYFFALDNINSLDYLIIIGSESLLSGPLILICIIITQDIVDLSCLFVY